MFQNITEGIATAAGRVSIWAVVYRAQLGQHTLCQTPAELPRGVDDMGMGLHHDGWTMWAP